MSRISEITCAVIIVVISAMGWAINHYRDNAITYKEQRDKATEKLALSNATIKDMQSRQRAVAELDAKYTQELADAKAENDALQRKLDNGSRVRVKGRCPVPASTETASAASMGDDATVELSSVAGRNVLGIRDGIKQDQAKIAALQQFITEQCSQ